METVSDNIIAMLRLPPNFGYVLLLFTLILFVAPYIFGADFGVFKIPKFPDSSRQILKVVGPITFIVAILLHVPFWGVSATRSKRLLLGLCPTIIIIAIAVLLNLPYTEQPKERPPEQLDQETKNRGKIAEIRGANGGPENQSESHVEPQQPVPGKPGKEQTAKEVEVTSSKEESKQTTEPDSTKPTGSTDVLNAISLPESLIVDWSNLSMLLVSSDTLLGTVIDSFYLSTTEISNQQFCQFLNDQRPTTEKDLLSDWIKLDHFRSKIYANSNGVYEVVEGATRLPVVLVSWDGAKAFCQWLRDSTQWSVSLPTARQWEYVARNEYPMSVLRNDTAILSSDIVPVDSLSPETTKFYHLFGNVWEWCLVNGESREDKPIRGGSYLDSLRKIVNQYSAEVGSEMKATDYPPEFEKFFSAAMTRTHKKFLIGFRVVVQVDEKLKDYFLSMRALIFKENALKP